MTTTKTEYLELDGSMGEGGGQILRTALTLSMITAVPIRISQIRAGRQKPGLLRQHLTAVQAAAAICGATVEGATPGSQALTFAPGPIRGGDYRFAIGSAGSCTLVLQTVLPALWFADAPARICVSGGTHNPKAPPADFLIDAWLPLLQRMGVQTQIELVRHGFYPAGGGEVVAHTQPVPALQPLDLSTRGAHVALNAVAMVAGVPVSVALREVDCLRARLPAVTAVHQELSDRMGPGNAVLVRVQHENVTELFIGLGEKGIAAERVADRVAQDALSYLRRDAAVGEYLADQLLLPLALAGAGTVSTTHASSHLITNAQVIEKFLDVSIEIEADGAAYRITVR
ncbi:RNA 3'-terminal phosphate cyclase [Silvimonas sp. JCM 19000]